MVDTETLESYAADIVLGDITPIMAVWEKDFQRKWDPEIDLACLATHVTLISLWPGMTTFPETIERYNSRLVNRTDELSVDLALREFGLGFSFVMKYAGNYDPKTNTYGLRTGWRERFIGIQTKAA